MVFIQLRFTPCQFTEKSWGGVLEKSGCYLMEHIRSYYGKANIAKYICVLETLDKYGDICDPHFHINLEVPDHTKTKDNFQKLIRRLTAGIKGNSCYSVRYIEDPEDEDRWWRYCIKEKIAKPVYHSFSKEWVQLNRILAVDERTRTIKFNRASRERNLQKDTFRLKLFKNVTNTLKNQPISSNMDKTIYCLIICFYQENNKTPPFNNLDNIVIDYKLMSNVITPEEYYNIHH